MKLFSFLSLFLCIALIGGCGGSSEEGEPTSRRRGGDSNQKVFRLNIGASPKTIDPTILTAVSDSRVLHATYEGLVRVDADNNPQPALAESWEISEDNRTFTFKLRQNAKWHNGDPVTAHDFVFGVRRILTPALAAEYASMVAGLIEGGPEYYAAGGLNSDATLSSVEAIDDYTVVYRMSNPSPFFITLASFPTWFPINEKVVAQHGDTWANSASTFVGNGPMRLTRYAPGDVIVAERFADYWDNENIFWDKVELYMITAENTLNAAYMAGDIDVANTVAVSEVPYWRERPDYRTAKGLGIYYVVFNTERAPFNNRDVRRAFQVSVDRELIVNRVTRRGEIVAQGFVPSSLPGVAAATYRETAGDMIGGQNIEEAKQLLANSGVTLTSVEYIFNVLDEHRLIGEQLQSMWRNALGVDVRLQQMEFGVLKSRLISGDYQFGRAAWIGDYIDPLTFLELFTSDSTSNDPKYKNPRYDALIAAARAEGDPAKREQFFIEAERILIVEDAVVCPIYDYVYAFLVKPEIEGFTMNSLANMDFIRARRK